MTSTLCLPIAGTPAEVAAVRRLIRTGLSGLPDALVYDVATAGSELATNAVRHSRSGQPGGKFVLSLEVAASTVTVAVTDEGRDDDHGPKVDASDVMRECGMGLGVCATLGELAVKGDRTGRTVSVCVPIAPGGAA